MRLLFLVCFVAIIFFPSIALAQTPPPRADPDLGILRLRQQPLQIPKPVPRTQKTGNRSRLIPNGALLLRLSYHASNNLFSGVDPVTGGLIAPGVTFWAAPRIGEKTTFIAVIDVIAPLPLR